MKLELKDGEEEVELCKAWEDMKKEVEEKTAARIAAETAERVAETAEATLLQDLRNLMETLHLSAEQAMAALKVPEAERSRFSAMI